MQIKIDEIIVEKRIRQDLGDLSSLAKSLDKHGQLNAITITPERQLIAGERRLEAAKLLGWETINAHVLSKLDAKTKLEIELAENRFRKPFLDEELQKGLAKLEKLSTPSFWSKMMAAIKKFFTKIFKRSL